jgi:sugar lactone lactonase YvrE
LSGPGSTTHVFSPSGELEAKHAAPADMPMRVAFGDADMGSLYLTTGGGHLYRAQNTGRKGVQR